MSGVMAMEKELPDFRDVEVRFGYSQRAAKGQSRVTDKKKARQLPSAPFASSIVKDDYQR